MGMVRAKSQEERRRRRKIGEVSKKEGEVMHKITMVRILECTEWFEHNGKLFQMFFYVYLTT